MKATAKLLRAMTAGAGREKRRVLFVGQSYYNGWYLSRALRELGWVADVINFDESPDNALFYHGEDFKFSSRSLLGILDQLTFYPLALIHYQIFFFANMGWLSFGTVIPRILRVFGEGSDIKLMRFLGKKIFYANNGCLDGVSQTAFSRWGPENVCDSCAWQNRPDVCSDERNTKWGAFRNSLTDYQVTLGGNRVDFNDDPRVHESPWFYCLDKNFWNPDLLIPTNYLLPLPRQTVKLYHSVGNLAARSHGAGKLQTIKSTHIYVPLVEQLQEEGYDVELIFFTDVPNRKIRYYQAQADVVLEMLTFGWYGANAREAMMLGKPVICFLRPAWLESVRAEIPDYVEELPIVNATPATVYEVLRDLVEHPAKRQEIGRKSRKFAEKWHASDVAARHFDKLFREILHAEKQFQPRPVHESTAVASGR